MRWQNNPFAGDSAGAGAVAREGIAALDPVNGLPLSWNPGRARGVGAQALFATSQGLWVGSDTNQIGGQQRGRIALMPLAGGTVVPSVAAASLPNDLFLAPQTGTRPPPSPRQLDRLAHRSRDQRRTPRWTGRPCAAPSTSTGRSTTAWPRRALQAHLQPDDRRDWRRSREPVTRNVPVRDQHHDRDVLRPGHPPDLLHGVGRQQALLPVLHPGERRRRARRRSPRTPAASTSAALPG